MLRHYKLLRLKGDDGKWAFKELEEKSEELLPKDMDEKKTKEFVDEMSRIAEKNPYLMNFLKKAQGYSFNKLSEKVDSEGNKVIPDAVAFAIVLERLTKAMYNNPKIIEKSIEVFGKAREKEGAFKQLPFFHKIKLLSVELPMKKTYMKAHRTGIVPPKSGSIAIPLNILEATISDYLSGYKNNASTGWTLAVNRPGSKEYDPRTGAGPSGWSDDKKAITRSMPLPKEWADLYQTWNMSFVSKIQDFPYIVPKLLIPQVANYEKKPTEYIYNRAIALYIYLNHASFDYVEKIKNNEPIIDWTDDKLTTLWGKSNLESKLAYNRELPRRRSEHKLSKNSKRKINRGIFMPKIKTQKKKEIDLIRNRMLEGLNKGEVSGKCMNI